MRSFIVFVVFLFAIVSFLFSGAAGFAAQATDGGIKKAGTSMKMKAPAPPDQRGKSKARPPDPLEKSKAMPVDPLEKGRAMPPDDFGKGKAMPAQSPR